MRTNLMAAVMTFLLIFVMLGVIPYTFMHYPMVLLYSMGVFASVVLSVALFPIIRDELSE